LTDWHGIFPAICTPFTPDDEVDLEAQRRVVRFAVERGAHGLVVFGLAGEVLKLSSPERMALMDVILEEANGDLPVLVGVGAESVRAALELARYAESAGASGVVVPAPTSARPGDGAVVDYFVRVAHSISLPLMIQDAPLYLGVALGPRLVAAAAARAENIRLVKLEAGPAEMRGWLDALGDTCAIWGGDGGLYELDCVRAGAAGIIPGVDLVDLLVEIYELERAGDSDQAEAAFARILPTLVFEMQSMDHFNCCAKHVLSRRGVLEHAGLRQPAAPFADGMAAILDRYLDTLDLPDVRARAAG
jgi:4-hydroxy-tetrahydrodipicolinate synthase